MQAVGTWDLLGRRDAFGHRDNLILLGRLFEWLSGRDADVAGRMVFMTGGVYTAEARAFLDRIPNPRVEKPFRLEDLQAILRRIPSP